MALVNRCVFNALSGGTGSFVVGSGVVGYATPSQAGAINGAIYSYGAQSSDLTQWEVGTGTYNSGSGMITRTVLLSSNSNLLVSFSSPPVVFLTALSADFYWPSNRQAKTSTYTVADADKGAMFALGGAAFYSLSFNAASSYDSNFVVTVVNEDAGRAKNISLTGGTSFILWPGQVCTVFNDNNTWVVTRDKRWKLTGNLTINVDPTNGNDANDGLASGSSAVQTVARAWAIVQNELDLAGNTVTIQLANTTYSSGVIFSGDWVGNGKIILDGGGGTITASTSGVDAVWISIPLGTPTTFDQFKIQNATITCTSPVNGGDALHVQSGNVVIGSGVTFGAVSVGAHIYADGVGARVYAFSNYTISGGASVAHIWANEGGYILQQGSTVTLTGTPLFTWFAAAFSLGTIQAFSMTYSGGANASTVRYLAAAGMINTGTGNVGTVGGGTPTAAYFPGGVGGSAVNGGLYY